MRMASSSKKSRSRTGSNSMLKPGTTLLTCEPFVYASYPQSPGLQICDACLVVKDTGLLLCKSCQTVMYCNRTCQKKGWKDGHKHECKGLPELVQTLQSVPGRDRLKSIWLPRILLRLVVKLKDGNDYYDELDIGGTNVKLGFWDLKSCNEELLEDKKYLNEVQGLMQTLELLIKPDSEMKIPSESELIELHGRTTAIEIGDGFNTVGAGIYLGSSILKHSCNPMAARVFDGATLHVRNIVEIPKSLPIDQVTMIFSNPLIPSPERKKKLKDINNMYCVCERCETGQFDKEMRSVICSNDGCNAKIDTEDIKKPCSVCGHVMKTDAIQKVLETEKYAGSQLDTGLGLGFVEIIIRRMKSVNFSETHWVMLRVFEEAYDAAAIKNSFGQITNLKKAFEYGSKYIKGIRLYLPPNDKHLMWHLFEMSLFAVDLGRLDEAEKLIAEAEAIGKVLYGKNSPFQRTYIDPQQARITSELLLMRAMKRLTLASMRRRV